MKDAMAQVKDELGDDAVILHTKKIKKGGILGYGAKEIFEVTAALDEVPRRPPKKREERLPTLAELQVQDASAKEPPKSAVPLPQGHAARAVQGEIMTPLAVPQEGQARAVSASVAAAVDPLPVQMPVQQATAAAQPQRRLSQSAAKSYKTAGTEAAVAEAKRQAYDSMPDVTAPVVAGKEPFVPAFPSQEQAAESFLPLVPAAEKAESLEPPVRKVRRRRAATVKRRKLRAAEKKDTLDEAAASSSATSDSGVKLLAPVAGTLLRCTVAEGTKVSEGQTVIMLESMKMELEINAHKAGVIHFMAATGAQVSEGELLAEIR